MTLPFYLPFSGSQLPLISASLLILSPLKRLQQAPFVDFSFMAS